MDIFLALTLGVIAGLITNSIWHQLYKVRKIFGDSKYSLSGLYVTKFSADAVPGEFIEVVEIQHKNRDTLDVSFETYNSNDDRNRICKGYGYIRSSHVGIVFYYRDNFLSDIGTIILKSKSTNQGDIILSGYFSQIIDREETKRQIYTSPYKLVGVETSFKKRINKLIKGRYFENYDDCKKFIENSLELNNEKTLL